jgi:divalent metal cation (Fe/Co/Zn/Cd) transporter
LDFHDSLKAGRVEETVNQIEQDIKARFPDVKRLFIEVQSQRDHDRVAAAERRAERASGKDG